tara:strand:+ start:20624 stop:20848 length:225 start_codon:yes stop_codon:yes gene_type:complete
VSKEEKNKTNISAWGNIKVSENSFELILRILGNEFVAIKIGSTNFSGKLIAGGVLLLFFTFVIMELFGFDDLLK